MRKSTKAKTSYAVKISPKLRRKVKEFCNRKGIKQGYFVESALKEKLEREEIIEDIIGLKTLRHEETLAIPFEKYLEKR